MVLVLGIDEAGRGALCGPMIIAGAMVEESLLPKIVQAGARDSKLLSPHRREVVRQKLEGLVKSFVVEIPPKEIDSNNLNELELDTFARIIRESGADKVFVDAMEANTLRVKSRLLDRVQGVVQIIAENKADTRYPIVGAASIFAKTTRDEIIMNLRKEFGDFGSGYPSDPRTKTFIDEWFMKHRSFPDFVRKKWSTLRKYDSQQLTLNKF